MTPGYEKMFGSSLARSRLILLSLCVFVAVYSASSALGMEYDLKVMNLLRSTKRGRLPILTTKIGTVFENYIFDGSFDSPPFHFENSEVVSDG